MRHYEVMVILDPTLDERTVQPSLETFLNVIRTSGGNVEKVEVWGKRRLSFEINKHTEGIYAVLDVDADPDAVKELDRQLGLQESVLRTKVLRRDPPGQIRPRIDDIEGYWTPLEKSGVEQALACSVVGGEATVRAGIAAFIEPHRPDEIMLTANVFDHAARVRSFEIAAQVCSGVA